MRRKVAQSLVRSIEEGVGVRKRNHPLNLIIACHRVDEAKESLHVAATLVESLRH